MAGLRHIAFYASLLNQPLTSEGDPSPRVASQSHVLVYGAIEAHSYGERGCIASNKQIGAETGLSASRVASIISEIANAIWVEVEMDEKNHRILITPLLTLAKSGNPPSQQWQPPLASSGNIDNNIGNNETQGANALASQQEELLGNLNEVAGRTFRVLPRGTAKLLKTYSVAEIRQALDALASDPWHKQRLKSFSSDYLLRLSTIEKFFVDGITKQRTIRPAQKDTLIEKLREGNI